MDPAPWRLEWRQSHIRIHTSHRTLQTRDVQFEPAPQCHQTNVCIHTFAASQLHISAGPPGERGTRFARVGQFLSKAGASADSIVADIDDRDAGYWESQGRNTWLDETNRTVPNFRRLFNLMTHLDDLQGAHGIGVAFGAGDGNTTTPETDGGHLISLVKAYGAAPRPACP